MEHFEYTYNGLLPEAFGDADVNWNKEVYKQMALSQQANFSYFGGNENTNYSFSLGAMDQEGMTQMKGSNNTIYAYQWIQSYPKVLK